MLDRYRISQIRALLLKAMGLRQFRLPGQSSPIPPRSNLHSFLDLTDLWPSGETVYVLNGEVRKIFHKLYSKIREVIYKLPFTAPVREISYSLHFEIRKTPYAFDLKVSEIPDHLYSSIKLLSLTHTIGDFTCACA